MSGELPVSSGLPELDHTLGGLQAGDNVVWQMDDIEYYLPFTRALAGYALEQGERIVYFRFAGHAPVLDDEGDLIVHQLHPEFGFENFITQIHHTIREMGDGGYYVFDSLSALTTTCYSDRMIGNFFKLTCPYLRRKRTIAYFALYRHLHSYHALQSIEDTTQILVDVFRYRDKFYLQPTKSEGREDRACFKLQQWQPGRLLPVLDSARTAAVLSTSPWTGLRTAPYRMVGLWDRTFVEAEMVSQGVASGTMHEERLHEQFEKLVELIVPRDESLLKLARRYLTLNDLLTIWKRMIGTGMIGGKTMGMLLARAILLRDDPKWADRLESHDSFYVCSDVFYMFLVENNCWWDRQRQKDPESFKTGNDEARQRILEGVFPHYVLARFRDMLQYFGNDPIIVRSSSLLEDNFGNVFSGKYASIFCANQGTLEERTRELVRAVKQIYASTMSDQALDYRKLRGVLEKDEQMALLVQRVSGARYGRYFFPQAAGVAYSFNPYAWNTKIDPSAGFLRLVFGLGTRAVDRTDDDYTRVVALNVPDHRPESDFEAVKRHTQRRVDVIDLQENRFASVDFFDLVHQAGELPLSRFATRDYQAERHAAASGLGRRAQWILTFDNLLQDSSFVSDIRSLLGTLGDAYRSDVDVEFTANFGEDGSYTIDIVQCRRFPVRARTDDSVVHIPLARDDDVLLRAARGVIGQSRTVRIDRLIYVRPEAYRELTDSARYELASFIGKLAHADLDSEARVMIIGPGRWGTSTPSLGIPVSFSDINTVSIIWELDVMREGLSPDLSLGTHFFNDLVEMNMLYVAHRLKDPGSIYRPDRLEQYGCRLEEIVPGSSRWNDTVCLIDADSLRQSTGGDSPGSDSLRTDPSGADPAKGGDPAGGRELPGGEPWGRDGSGRKRLFVHADAVEQTATLYFGV